MQTTTRPILDIARQLLVDLSGLAYVAGGCARELYLGAAAPPAGDIDVYLYDNEAAQEVADKLEALDWVRGARQGQAQSWVAKPWDVTAQIIDPGVTEFARTVGQPAEVLAKFGFTTEQFAVEWSEADGGGLRFTVGDDAVADTLARRLRIAHITCPVGLAWRANKYGRKGYHLALGEALRLFQEWDRRSPEWKQQLAAATNPAELYALLARD